MEQPMEATAAAETRCRTMRGDAREHYLQPQDVLEVTGISTVDHVVQGKIQKNEDVIRCNL